MSGRPLPLSHLKVLDLSRLLPGPMATLYLADLGADVIRIEGPAEERLDEPLRGILCRNKRTVSLDLKRPGARAVFLRLARGADAVVEGFRPGVVDRLGVGYDAVREVNPRIVYCSITGYGQTGPDCLRAGHDINYLAVSGVGDQIGAAGGPPALPNLQIGDLLGGSMTAAMGILAALVDAQTRGTGRYLDVSITDSLISHSFVAQCAGAAERGAGMLSGGSPCYRYYRTRDGRYLAVGALERKFWDRLCDTLDRPDLKRDRLAWGEHASRVRDELSAIFGQHDLEHWVRVFQDVDCCVTPVRTPGEAAAARGARFGAPLRMTDLEFAAERPAAPAGAHTDEVLTGLGYSHEEIGDLRSAGVVGPVGRVP